MNDFAICLTPIWYEFATQNISPYVAFKPIYLFVISVFVKGSIALLNHYWSIVVQLISLWARFDLDYHFTFSQMLTLSDISIDMLTSLSANLSNMLHFYGSYVYSYLLYIGQLFCWMLFTPTSGQEHAKQEVSMALWVIPVSPWTPQEYDDVKAGKWARDSRPDILCLQCKWQSRNWQKVQIPNLTSYVFQAYNPLTLETNIFTLVASTFCGDWKYHFYVLNDINIKFVVFHILHE